MMKTDLFFAWGKMSKTSYIYIYVCYVLPYTIKCSDTILVFVDMPGNKSVNRTRLDWDTRVKISLGAALGIDYLHDCGFTHGNIKSCNILLTNNYNSCVSDYGLAQLVSTTSAANRVIGYRAPEVTDVRRVTPKADVYSFGVLLLEILTGKLPTHTSNEGGMDLPRWVQSVVREQWTASTSDEGIDLPRWVQSVVREEWKAEVFDPELTKYQSDVKEEMDELLQIALQCVAPSPDQRPTMKQVVKLIRDVQKNDNGSGDISKGANA